MKGRHVSRKRRESLIDLGAGLILVFGLSLFIWVPLAQAGTVAVWIVVLLMAARLVGVVAWRRYDARRAGR